MEIKIDGDRTTVEELCELMEELGGYFDGDSFSVITEGGRNRQHGRTSISPFSFPSTHDERLQKLRNEGENKQYNPDEAVDRVLELLREINEGGNNAH